MLAKTYFKIYSVTWIICHPFPSTNNWKISPHNLLQICEPWGTRFQGKKEIMKVILQITLSQDCFHSVARLASWGESKGSPYLIIIQVLISFRNLGKRVNYNPRQRWIYVEIFLRLLANRNKYCRKKINLCYAGWRPTPKALSKHSDVRGYICSCHSYRNVLLLLFLCLQALLTIHYIMLWEGSYCAVKDPPASYKRKSDPTPTNDIESRQRSRRHQSPILS